MQAVFYGTTFNADELWLSFGSLSGDAGLEQQFEVAAPLWGMAAQFVRERFKAGPRQWYFSLLRQNLEFDELTQPGHAIQGHLNFGALPCDTNRSPPFCYF